MIDFIILEDDIYYLNKYKLMIDKIMMNYDIDYNITILDKYDSKRKKLIKEDTFKIIILDYDKKKNSDSFIEDIREKMDDWQSLIIAIYNKIEDKEELEKKRFFITDYIDKTKNIDQVLLRGLQICLKNYDQRPNSLKYCYKKIFYNIEYQKILFIEKEQDNKRCMIKTNKRDYYIQGSLNKIEKLLDNRFFKCNRSYIINLEQIESFDSKKNILYFKNNTSLSIVSRTKRKEIINYLRGIY